MTFIRNLTSPVAYKTISVEIDPLLLANLDTNDKTTTTRIITFSLYKLIYHIGTIQSRRFATSNRLKFFDKSDLIEKIYYNSGEFRLKINDIRTINGSETLTSVSEDFGVGISVVIAESLFKIKRSTIERISGTGRRPDWKCQTEDNRILVVEAKGSISMQTSLIQEVNALEQKTKELGDIQVASLTVLNENSISTNRFLDPPIDGSNISPIMENHILRAGHYASVFSFLGNSKLSRYYSQMRKRLKGKITPFEQESKESIYRSLREDDPTIHYESKAFAGTFYAVENNKYLYVGVDKELLSYKGFIEFKDYENDSDTMLEDNHYILFKDGVLIIEIEKIENFSNLVTPDSIKNYQNKITISDIDEMNEFSFLKFFISLLERNGFVNIREQVSLGDFRVDLVADYNNTTYYFEFKIYRKKAIYKEVFIKYDLNNQIGSNGNFIIVTNSVFKNASQIGENIKVIDRQKLKEISDNYRNIIEIIINK